MNTAVLIVGAGPTGLTLGCSLARAGAAVRIIDKTPEFHRGSRGKGLNQRSRELLADLGLDEELTAAGTEHIVLRKYRDGVPVADTRSWDSMEARPDVPYSSGLLLPQWRTEELLRGKLAEYGVRVELGCELTGFTQDEQGVRATLADGRTIEADYLAGCDGGKSFVRKALGVGFEGETAAEEMMVLGDVEVDGLDRGFWHQWFGEGGGIMLCPFRGTSHWQLQGAAGTDERGRLPEPTLEVFQDLFDRVAGVPGVRLANPTWQSTYRVNVRMADRFREGRVFIVGDAAHVHSIAGGLGMNTGIQDAFNLGWKLALVIGGHAGPGLLDTYEEERLPVAAWTLKTSNEGLRRIVEGVPAGRIGTDVGANAETSTLGVGYRWSSLSGGAGEERAADGDGLAAGDRAPDAPCRDAATGRPVRLFEKFAGPGHTLLGFGPHSAKVLARAGEEYAGPLRTCLIDGGPEGLDDHEGHARAAYGMEGDGVVLVRPDDYVALRLTGDAPDRGAAVVDYLRRLGR
ncbi:FAD-dependent monooxygenase [Streptomyces sp. NPDC050617]|uniref:FAD-dependent monooxygenase n=1 Tax=Streptomyces sp. NPDC050617 TaxID=3154628 RepID=UPI00343C18BB